MNYTIGKEISVREYREYIERQEPQKNIEYCIAQREQIEKMKIEYNNLVSDLNLMVEKFEEIRQLQIDENKRLNYSMNTKAVAQTHKNCGSISAYDNAIGVLKLLIKKD